MLILIELHLNYFNFYSNLESKSNSNLEFLISHISSVTNFNNKTKWIIEITNIQKKDDITFKMIDNIIYLKEFDNNRKM
ncbi:hypothetical protein [Flavobacterium sp.]|uniref:hypothetical protein n=1 Tax=Flavobacterium sp. TaxID=239 RepID=UPI0037536E87